MKKKLNEHILPPVGAIYDKYNQLKQTWQTQPAGDRNTNFYDKSGQLQYSITPDGTILDKHSQKQGKIDTDQYYNHVNHKSNSESVLTAKKIIDTLESAFHKK